MYNFMYAPPNRRAGHCVVGASPGRNFRVEPTHGLRCHCTPGPVQDSFICAHNRPLTRPCVKLHIFSSEQFTILHTIV